MSQKNKIAKFKSKHPQGRKKYAAEKALDKQTKKQEKNIKRGRKGHTPIIRKLIK